MVRSQLCCCYSCHSWLLVKLIPVGVPRTCAVTQLSRPSESETYRYLAYRASRRIPVSNSEAVLIGRLPEGDNHELFGDLPQVIPVCSQAAGTTIPSEGPDHRPSVGASQTVCRPLQGETHLDNQASLERSRSIISDPSHRRSHESVQDILTVHYRRNIKEIEQYFPLTINSLSSVGESQESTDARLSLLHRYKLVKFAETTMDLRKPIALFALHLCIGIVAAVFLNSSDDVLGFIGTILNILSIVLGNLKSVRRLHRFLRRKLRRAER